MFADIGWVDTALLAVLVLSLAIGALRGLVFEVMAIAGWVAAYFAARWGAPLLAPHLPVGPTGSVLNQAASYAFVFIATLIVWSLVSRLLRRLVRATPLAPIDRVLGAAFGLLRGAVVLLAVAVLVGATPAARAAPWRDSVGAAWLGAVLSGIRPLLPIDLANLLPA